MREPNIKWFFQPPGGGGEGQGGRDGTGRGDEGDSAPGLIDLPAALLERHGARVLDPGEAAAVAGFPVPRPTVYRARTLLVPDHLLQQQPLVGTINTILADVGMELKPPRPFDDTADQEGDVFEALRQLPRPTVLEPVEGRPVVVDAWVALQAVRAATVRRQPAPDEAATGLERPVLDKAVVDQISLEHLLIGSAITGSPASNSGGIAGGPGSGSDVSGPTATDSYLFSGGEPRTPIAVIMNKPERRSQGACVEIFGRRPVIAVLDSGIRSHHWTDVTAAPGGGYKTDPPDGFVQIDEEIQDAIRKEGQHAVDNGDKHRQVIEDASDTPMTANRLVGELNPALGHSTFIAGIVRQVTPDAQVLAVRIMHSDDILNEGDIICALRHLAKRIALAEEGDLAAMVDVVSLSFGYFSESRHDDVVLTSGLWRVIKVLLSLGVVVVAAAGNFATSRRFYPAAFARETVPAGQVPVISVGALNPNGTKAVFSNDGHWVTAWARGAAMVSTYPIDVDASRTPELRIPVNRRPPGDVPPGREALDPNDYSDGFAVWSGTSFSAPYVAALITRSMLEGAARSGSGLRLDVPGKQAARGRAAAALDNLPPQG